MSWIQDLIATYDQCQTEIGLEREKQVPLLPMSHSTQMAQVEIVLDGEGNFRRARVVPKSESRTIIPVTEKSGNRTSGEAAHPLCDKLQYIAGDYKKFGGGKASYIQSFLSQLQEWAGSPFGDPKINAILNYVKQGRVIQDLVDQQIFITDGNGKLSEKPDKQKGTESPAIFAVLNSQFDAFVRWVVEAPGMLETRVWRDQNLWEKWKKFYLILKEEKDFSYLSGKEEFVALMHLGKIRNDGDKAKLISGNDENGFTYRGRFTSAAQATTVSYEESQKSHLVLRWLISRQGYSSGDLSIVAWAVSGGVLPQLFDDTLDLLGISDLAERAFNEHSLAQDLAVRLRKKIAGYSVEVGEDANVVVMGVDSATPGRLSIVYYNRLKGSDFLQKIEGWHQSCAWLHRYRFIKPADDEKAKAKMTPFIGAPAPADIAEAAYGPRVDERLKQATVMRILPCIVEGRPIPKDLAISSVNRACCRAGKDLFEWEKTLSIACALYRQYFRKENFEMTLEPERKTRDYLFGRLLALAENIEAWALSKADEKRETNAARLMQRFAEHPFSTWRTLELALTPYKIRLGGKAKSRLQMIDEILAAFVPDDFTSDKRLSGEFLLGYHCQREALRVNRVVSEESEEEN